MQIVMVPGLCSNEYSPTSGSFCESCFARFLMHHGSADLPCFTAVTDDSGEEQTLIMRFGGQERRVLLTDAAREELAYGGWRGWKDYVAQQQLLAEEA